MEEIRIHIFCEFRRFDDSRAVYKGTLPEQTGLTMVIADAAQGEIESGVTYAMTGKWKDHPKYGRQFIADSFVESVPVTREATIFYLTKYQGIGPRTAEKVYEYYGADALEAIAKDPSYLATFRGIDAERAQNIGQFVAEDLKRSRGLIEIQSFLAGSGFPKGLAKRIYQKWGVRSIQMIIRNPYLLLSYDGCGFLSVDKFALAHGYPPERLKRQALFLLYQMEESEDCWYSETDLNRKLVAQFGASSQYVRALRLLAKAKRIKPVHKTPTGKDLREWHIALAKDAENERFVAEDMCARLIERDHPGMDLEGQLLPAQAEALSIATSHYVGCLVGGPGTGKTYTVARYIKAIIATHGEDSILVVAPTGKAVVRSREMLASINANCNACTMHSYVYGINRRFYEYIVVDESSMVDLQLMRDFLEASRDSKILFVGDDGQLLPVGKGRPFADFIQSGKIPVGRLTQTMRNSGKIVEVCSQIRQNQPWTANNDILAENLALVRASDVFDQIMTIINTWYRGRGTDLIRDIQVIVGLNKGPNGRDTLNKQLQWFMNGTPSPGHKYMPGDPVICLKNGKYKTETAIMTGGEEAEIYLSNGEIGYCTQTEPRILVDFGEGKEAWISETSLAFDLAYAVTGHKMQGSETPVAIVILDPSYQARTVCNREWLYTAISRAKHHCWLVGEKSTADLFCRQLGNVRRTFLAEHIQAERIEGETGRTTSEPMGET